MSPEDAAVFTAIKKKHGAERVLTDAELKAGCDYTDVLRHKQAPDTEGSFTKHRAFIEGNLRNNAAMGIALMESKVARGGFIRDVLQSQLVMEAKLGAEPYHIRSLLRVEAITIALESFPSPARMCSTGVSGKPVKLFPHNAL